MKSAIFVDWITASQFHPSGGLPVVTGGVVVHYDASGVPRFERNCAARVSGSHETAVRVGCDGFRVFLSGNPGRFARQDNLFNHGIAGTIKSANAILASVGLPPFTVGSAGAIGQGARAATVSRLDITCNYKTGSDGQARAVIRWLAGRSVARAKRGFAGDESVWFANTRRMLKAYVKHAELLKHGHSAGDPVVDFCRDQGVVRVEVELKKRLLSELRLTDLADITDERLAAVFREQTEVFRAVDRSDEPDLIAAIPQRSRAYASAWLAGQDVRLLASRATLFRHARLLREYGLDILEPRNLERFPVRVRVVDLEALPVPDWYKLERVA